MKAHGDYQLDGKTLYERQKRIRSNPNYLFGPTIVVENLHTPENLGSILRLADAAGTQEVLFLTETNVHNLSKIKKMARNCEAVVRWKTEPVTDFLEESAKNNPNLIAIELTAHSTNLFDVCFPRDCAFVVGNERFGISAALLARCSQAVHVPMYGVNGSMNVAHALAIVLFEWRRQVHLKTAGSRWLGTRQGEVEPSAV